MTSKKAPGKIDNVKVTVAPPAPQPEPAPPALPTSGATLKRLDTLEESVEELNRKVGEVRETNRLMNVVLFVGFLALALSFIGSTIQALRTPAPDSNSALTQELLQLQINELKASHPSSDVTTSPSPAPSKQ